MTAVVKFSEVEDKIIVLRDVQVVIDRDVAQLYDVPTREINRAIKNNPDKFPQGYLFKLNKQEKTELVENFHRFNPLKHSTVTPTAFTERGLYMLATIIKSEQATQTTLAIIETFSKIRELSRTIGELSAAPDESGQKSLMHRSSEIITDILGEDMKTTDTETEIELNFTVLKFKHTIKRKTEK
ncbi:MAG: ORF6N domain-containing protein [Neisseria sp.]|nr:ORF6N domain-containing protein [Neisseria sp.]